MGECPQTCMNKQRLRSQIVYIYKPPAACRVSIITAAAGGSFFIRLFPAAGGDVCTIEDPCQFGILVQDDRLVITFQGCLQGV